MASDDGAPEPRYNQVSLLVSFALGVTLSGESLSDLVKPLSVLVIVSMEIFWLPINH